MAQAAIVVPCDICDTDQDARFYCTVCEEYLCSNCKIYHSKFKTTKDHKVIPISEAKEGNITKTPEILCGDHPTEQITIYCRQCDQLICTECLNGSHEGHKLTSLKQMQNTATGQLSNLKKKLKDRKLSNEQNLKTEGKIHMDYMASIKQCRKDISDQKENIIKELNIICDEEFAELSSLEEKEVQRYSNACANIQKQQQIVTTAIQTVQNGLQSGHPASMLQARENATKSTERLDDLIPVQQDSPKFQRSHIERKALRQHLGSLYAKQSGARQKQEVSTEASERKKSAKTSRVPNINKLDVDVNTVKIKFTVTVKDKSGCIKIIIPTHNNCTWVSFQYDTKLTLINDQGDTITTSVTLDRQIQDAKAYNNDILVTCNGGQQVFRLSEDGTIKSTFSDLHPYITYGLCVTNNTDVLVCLYKYESDNLVVRLGKNGEIIQTIQKDSTGHPLYGYPYRVTAVPTGEILVTEARLGRVTCVDRNGQHLFTWAGQVEGKQAHGFHVYGITQDNYNVFVTDLAYNKVYTLRKDGTGAKCVLDNTHRIVNPWGMALDDSGQLLVGCRDGKIHVIEYH